MTEVKIDPKLNKPITKALEDYADELLAAPLGTRYVAICELAVVEHAERSNGETDEDGEPLTVNIVKIRPVLMEIAPGEDEDHVRRALRALWTKRTAPGTITGAEDTANADANIQFAAGLIGGAE